VRLDLVPRAAPAPRIVGLRLISDLADQDHRLEILSRSSDHVVVRAHDLPSPRVLVLLDAYYRGWECLVDGRPARVLRAQGTFKAVALDPGTHTVEWRFSSPTLHAGVGISLLGWLAALLGLCLAASIGRRPR
jgi:uncharacterized membrane protein YfhO